MTRNARTALRASLACLVLAMPGASGAGLAPDNDSDGIPDVLDKCMVDSRNATAPRTCDTDQDGYGNVCDPDFDQNFTVNAEDFGSYFIPAFKGGSMTRGQDMDCTGTGSAVDFGSYFVPKFKGFSGGSNPGPSGLSCAGTTGCK